MSLIGLGSRALAVALALACAPLWLACSDATSAPADAAADAPRQDAGTDSPSGDTAVADGVAGDAPATGDLWRPDGPTSAADPQKAAKAAVLAASCVPDDSPPSWLDDIYYDRKVSPRLTVAQLACLAGKTNGCKGVEECLGISVGFDPLCAKGCQGNKATLCDNSTRFDWDCSRAGLVCKDGNCLPAGSYPPCDPSSYATRCAAGRPTYCQSKVGERLGFECAQLGLKCAEIASFGRHGCQGPGATCKSSVLSGHSVHYNEGLSCTTGTLTACVNDGAATVDCSDLGAGFTCQQHGATIFCGLASECDPNDRATELKCAGDALQLCNAGKRVTVDCKALGFSGCAASGKRCAP